MAGTVALRAMSGAAKDGLVPVLVSVQPPEGATRQPSDVCAVVDVSGSMGSEALIKSEDGSMSGHGFSVLDIVRHSLKTIIRNLGNGDRLALVAYSSDAKTVFGLTPMNDAGKTTTEAELERLVPGGLTNLWGGLKMGIDILQAGAQGGDRLQHIMLFTDGLPNCNPPRGILPMLKRLKDKEGGKLPCTVNTFGFGYELDSELLCDLAVEGSGSYNFIPDSGFVGTVFVNATTNLLVSFAKNATLCLKPLNGASFAPTGLLGSPPSKRLADGSLETISPTGLLGSPPSKKLADGSLEINVGVLQYGQSRDFIIMMEPSSGLGDLLEATLTYSTTTSAQPSSATEVARGVGDADSILQVERQRLRLLLVGAIRQAMKRAKGTVSERAAGKDLLPEAQAVIQETCDEIAGSQAANEEAIEALLEDCQGQVCEAFSREEWYSKWGTHYLPSLMFAHLMQQCNNFKDAGVQVYGGKLFNDLRDIADDIFCSLPAPTPTAQPPPAPTPAYVPAAAPPPVAMAAFYDRYAG